MPKMNIARHSCGVVLVNSPFGKSFMLVAGGVGNLDGDIINKNVTFNPKGGLNDFIDNGDKDIGKNQSNSNNIDKNQTYKEVN